MTNNKNNKFLERLAYERNMHNFGTPVTNNSYNYLSKMRKYHRPHWRHRHYRYNNNYINDPETTKSVNNHRAKKTIFIMLAIIIMLILLILGFVILRK